METLWHGKKFVVSIFCALMSLSLVSGYIFSPIVVAFDVGKSKQSKVELQKKKKELAAQLKKANEDVTKEAKNKDALDNKITIVQQQIDVSNKYISDLENEILDVKAQIESIKESMENKIILLRKSLASIYVSGDTSTLDIILGAKDFEDFLDKTDIVRSVSKTVKKLIDDLKNDLKVIEEKEKRIKATKKDQEDEKNNLEKSRTNLQGLYDESEKLLGQLQDSEKKAKDAIDQNNEQIKKIDSEITRYFEEQKRKQEEEEKRRREEAAKKNKPIPSPSQKVVHKGGFIWPVPGFKTISSGFSDTQDRAHVHGAIDIAGHCIYGASIVASASGRVIMVNCVVDSKGRGGGGYGKYVVIDHGNGISTLYGHMSNVAVSVGQTVSQGQLIGNVGNTGFSTGPHLHFEYRVNGIRRNPREILSY